MSVGNNKIEFFDKKIGWDEWLDTCQAARYLCITPNALRILVHRGQIRAYKFGRRLRFRTDDLLKLHSLRRGA